MALKSIDKSRLQKMHDNLATQIAEINCLAQTEVEFNKLEHLINQKQLKIDKIQTFTYISLSKRQADHAYFHCCLCDVTFEMAPNLLQHKFAGQCWSCHEQLSESKQKLYVCRLCDRIYQDYRSIVVHIVIEFILNGYTIPTENLDLSQCITILYIEQLHSSNMEMTLHKIKGLLNNSGKSGDNFMDEIDKLEAEIDKDEDDQTVEFTIDLEPTEDSPNGKQPLVSVSVKDLKKSFSFQPKSSNPSSTTSPIKIISLDSKPTSISFENKPTKVIIQPPQPPQKPNILIKALPPPPEPVKIKEEPIEVKKEPLDITDDPLAGTSGETESMIQIEDQIKVEVKMEPTEPTEPEVATLRASTAIELTKNPVVGLDYIKPKRGRPRKNSLEVRKSFDDPPGPSKSPPKKKEKIVIAAKKDKYKAAVPEKKIQPPLRETSKRNRTPKRKFAIEETMDSGEIQSDEEMPTEEEMLMPVEPVVEITEAHEDLDDDVILNEMECLNGLKSVVWDNRGNADTLEKQLKVVNMAQKEIEALNDVSAELQKSLHMEKAKNLQLKQKMDNDKRPKLAPIKIKITGRKSAVLSK